MANERRKTTRATGMVAVIVAVAIGCSSDGPFSDRDIDAVASAEAAESIEAGVLGLSDLDDFYTEWEPLANHIGRLKAEVEENGKRLDLTVVLEAVIDQFPSRDAAVWNRSLELLTTDPTEEIGSRTSTEFIATAVVLANDQSHLATFAAQVGDTIDASELSLAGSDRDFIKAQAVIIDGIRDGEADARRAFD